MAHVSEQSLIPERMLDRHPQQLLSGKQWGQVDQFVLRERERIESAPDLAAAHKIVCESRTGKSADTWLACILAGLHARKIKIAGHEIKTSKDLIWIEP